MESFLSFLSASHYPRLGAEETTNQEIPMVSDKKKKENSTKGFGKRQPTKTETFGKQ